MQPKIVRISSENVEKLQKIINKNKDVYNFTFQGLVNVIVAKYKE